MRKYFTAGSHQGIPLTETSFCDDCSSCQVDTQKPVGTVADPIPFIMANEPGTDHESTDLSNLNSE